MPELHKQLSYMGAELLHEVLNGYPYSFQNAKKQNNNLATYGKLFGEYIPYVIIII